MSYISICQKRAVNAEIERMKELARRELEKMREKAGGTRAAKQHIAAPNHSVIDVSTPR